MPGRVKVDINSLLDAPTAAPVPSEVNKQRLTKTEKRDQETHARLPRQGGLLATTPLSSDAINGTRCTFLIVRFALPGGLTANGPRY